MALRANAAHPGSFRKFCAAERAAHRGAVEPGAPPGHMGIMSTKSRNNPQPPPAPADEQPPTPPADGSTVKETVKEIGGPKGPEPTRYGDWEVGGRCTDF
jgi:hypothetical protein